MAERLAVIGADAAGMSAAATARRRDKQLEIHCFDRGPHSSYSACGIPYYVAGAIPDADRLISRSPEEFRMSGITMHMRTEVLEIDLDRRELLVREQNSGQERREGFDRLMYATGAQATPPPIPGADAVEPVRTVDAGRRFDSALKRDGNPRAVVIGSGYIGLEMAEALVERERRVTLIDQTDQVFPSLDPDIASHVQDAAEGVGIRVRLGAKVTEIEHDDDLTPRAVHLEDEVLPADYVVLATGVRPLTELAQAAGMQVGESGALLVDDHQRCVGVDGVWAGGDCVESHHRVLGRGVNIQLGTHANKQGRIAGINLTGGDAAFPGVIGTAASKICDIEVSRTGLSEKEAAKAGIDVVTEIIKDKTRAGYFPGSRPIWVKLTAEPGTGKLLGGQIVGGPGSAKRIDVLATCVWAGLTVSEIEMLDLSYAPPFSGVHDPILVAARQAVKAVAAA